MKNKIEMIKRKISKLVNNIKKQIIESRKNRGYVPLLRRNTSFNLLEVMIIIVISILSGVFFCNIVNTYNGKTNNEIPSTLYEFIQTYNDISTNYYEDINKEELIEAGIAGMLNYLEDPYSQYMGVAVTESFNEQVNGKYVGIGSTISLEDNVVKIISSFATSPAVEAGIKDNDIITKIDGLDVAGLSLDEISDKIKGEEGSKVVLTIKRGEETLDITVTRKSIDLVSVTRKIFNVNNKKVGLIKISIFANNTAEQFKDNLANLEKDNIDSLVIDVRNNSGGYLTRVSEILSLFLNKKDVMYQLKTKEETTKIYDETKESSKLKVAILINEYSASGSEILACSLAESYNAITIGQTTFGKGTVQQAVDLKSGAMIKYTIEEWLSPLGNTINKVGVKPSIELELSTDYYENPIDENDNQLQKALELLTK